MAQKIGYNDLAAYGVSNEILNFFSRTQPRISLEDDGSYSIYGSPELRGLDRTEMIAALNELALNAKC